MDKPAEIPLTQGYAALVDAADWEWLMQYNWHYMRGYAARRENRKVILMHRFIMNTLAGMNADHIDSNRLNNQRHNLRNCTYSQNSCNQKPQVGCSSKYKGVYKNKATDKWLAYIRVNGKRLHLGAFIDESEGALAYNAAALKYYGEFARLNEV